MRGKPSSSRRTIRSILRDRKWPEFLCLQEVKILADDMTQITRARNAANDGEDEGREYVMHSTLPVVAKRATQNRRMYGVITYVRADVAERVRTARGADWDDEGRVLILEMERFVLINVYAVNGTDAPYIPRSTGQPTGLTRHERKRIFNTFLKDEIIALKAKGLEVCVLGDINISRSKIDSVPRLRSHPAHVQARKEFNETFLPETGLVDAWREWHGVETKGFTWFARGAKPGTDCARVDMTLVSKGLYERATEVDIEEWMGTRSGSDHTLMWITIDFREVKQGEKAKNVEQHNE